MRKQSISHKYNAQTLPFIPVSCRTKGSILQSKDVLSLSTCQTVRLDGRSLFKIEFDNDRGIDSGGGLAGQGLAYSGRSSDALESNTFLSLETLFY